MCAQQMLGRTIKPIPPHFAVNPCCLTLDKAEKQGSKCLAEGTIPPAHIMTQLLPETQNICSTLANLQQHITTQKQHGISPEAFISLYKALDEFHPPHQEDIWGTTKQLPRLSH
jgi:hypothetical protein